MQEIHSIGAGGTRFFGGGGADRRLRPHLNNSNPNNNQALNCPRCDSINTKFCYYNNYNLSQPRHFCKNCRRYWTKGGVLRNVPVGGGCRKSKRSNKPKNSSSSEVADLPTTPPEPENKSNSHSSSESSSLTAAAVTEAVSEPTPPNSNAKINTGLDNDSLEQQGAGDCSIFSEIATFTSLITSSNDTLPFGFGNGNGNSNCNVNGFTDASSFNWQHHKAMTVTGDQPHQHEDALKLIPENLGTGGGSSGSLMDHGIDFSVLQSKTSNGGFGSLDWHGADQGLFDLPNTVDHGYWNHTQWSDQDQDQDHSNLFHLP